MRATAWKPSASRARRAGSSDTQAVVVDHEADGIAFRAAQHVFENEFADQQLALRFARNWRRKDWIGFAQLDGRPQQVDCRRAGDREGGKRWGGSCSAVEQVELILALFRWRQFRGCEIV
jgi:hypothetical protein